MSGPCISFVCAFVGLYMYSLFHLFFFFFWDLDVLEKQVLTAIMHLSLVSFLLLHVDNQILSMQATCFTFSFILVLNNFSKFSFLSGSNGIPGMTCMRNHWPLFLSISFALKYWFHLLCMPMFLTFGFWIAVCVSLIWYVIIVIQHEYPLVT